MSKTIFEESTYFWRLNFFELLMKSYFSIENVVHFSLFISNQISVFFLRAPAWVCTMNRHQRKQKRNQPSNWRKTSRKINNLLDLYIFISLNTILKHIDLCVATMFLKQKKNDRKKTASNFYQWNFQHTNNYSKAEEKRKQEITAILAEIIGC